MFLKQVCKKLNIEAWKHTYWPLKILVCRHRNVSDLGWPCLRAPGATGWVWTLLLGFDGISDCRWKMNLFKRDTSQLLVKIRAASTLKLNYPSCSASSSGFKIQIVFTNTTPQFFDTVWAQPAEHNNRSFTYGVPGGPLGAPGPYKSWKIIQINNFDEEKKRSRQAHQSTRLKKLLS